MVLLNHKMGLDEPQFKLEPREKVDDDMHRGEGVGSFSHFLSVKNAKLIGPWLVTVRRLIMGASCCVCSTSRMTFRLVGSSVKSTTGRRLLMNIFSLPMTTLDFAGFHQCLFYRYSFRGVDAPRGG